MAALVSWVCRVDHARRGDEVLAKVTIYSGTWAYCAQGSSEDCIFDATQPVSVEEIRSVRHPAETEAAQQASAGGAPAANNSSDDGDRVQFICVTAEHVKAGERVPDGLGTLTVSSRLWAYCTAGLLNAPHDWKETGGVPFESIQHAALPVSLSSP